MRGCSERPRVGAVALGGSPITQPRDITATLIRWQQGDRTALDVLTPLVYDQLRSLAASYLSRERVGHTLQPTALVNEAFLRLVDQTQVTWQNRAHFLGIAAQAMRRILVDHARRKRAAKRGEGAIHVSFEMLGSVSGPSRDVALDDLDAALDDLARLEPRQARVVELRFFGGLSIEEAAEVMGTSPATTKRDWTVARAFLHRALIGD